MKFRFGFFATAATACLVGVGAAAGTSANQDHPQHLRSSGDSKAPSAGRNDYEEGTSAGTGTGSSNTARELGGTTDFLTYAETFRLQNQYFDHEKTRYLCHGDEYTKDYSTVHTSFDDSPIFQYGGCRFTAYNVDHPVLDGSDSCLRYGHKITLRNHDDFEANERLSGCRTSSTSFALLKDPNTEDSSKQTTYHWYIRSDTPKSYNDWFEDSKTGECVPVGGTVVFQNVRRSNRWLTGMRRTWNAFVETRNLFDQSEAQAQVTYKWTIGLF